MDKKEVLIALIILLAVVLVAKNLQEKKTVLEPKKDIAYGDECAKDEDCGYTIKECGKAPSASCQNSCVRGRCMDCIALCKERPACGICPQTIKVCPDGSTSKCSNYCDAAGSCTRCEPACRQPQRCHNETCTDTIKLCSDGTLASCKNYCYLDKCSRCTPDCNRPLPQISPYIEQAIGPDAAAVSCEEEYVSTGTSLGRIDIPQGYTSVIDPFTVTSDGPLDLTLNIPDTYIDIQALRCRKEQCSNIGLRPAVDFSCSKNSRLKKDEYYEPQWLPINISEKKFRVLPDVEIKHEGYILKFRGDFDSFYITISMPRGGVREAINPALRITGTPLTISVQDKAKNLDATITMPYSDIEGFDEASLGIYLASKDGWEYVGGVANKEDKTITAPITGIHRFLDNQSGLQVAVMGVICISCYESSMEKVYQPKEVSKDAVILVHGFNPQPDSYKALIDEIRLTGQKFDVLTYNYPSSRLIKENARDFMSLIEKNSAPYDRLDIVAHSLGGLIAQQALYDTFKENENAEKYLYLKKVRKVVLIGTPNEGSPVAEVYKNLFVNLVNEDWNILHNPGSPVLDELAKGLIIPRVPGIDYNVVAGAKPYLFNLPLFKETNDGILTVLSAAHVGDGYIQDRCKNYWELNLTHTELTDAPLARMVIGKIISEQTKATLGHNRFYGLAVQDSTAGDSYVIIGRKISKEEVYDEAGCSCGNGICGQGEDEANCPYDCTPLPRDRNNVVALAVIISLCIIVPLLYIFKKRCV